MTILCLTSWFDVFHNLCTNFCRRNFYVDGNMVSTTLTFPATPSPPALCLRLLSGRLCFGNHPPQPGGRALMIQKYHYRHGHFVFLQLRNYMCTIGFGSNNSLPCHHHPPALLCALMASCLYSHLATPGGKAFMYPTNVSSRWQSAANVGIKVSR